MPSSPQKNIIVTGGAGFIGSALVRSLVANPAHQVLNIDKLTYAANPNALSTICNQPNYQLLKADICNTSAMQAAINAFKPDVIFHLAAESHVDRSIENSSDFIQTNIAGTESLLNATMTYLDTLSTEQQANFRFIHMSTDEVFGDIPFDKPPVDESAVYNPSSPYAASKAAADHLVRAWGRTYGLPFNIVHACNNVGPYQHREKLIPKAINQLLKGKAVPIYGDGQQSREWLFVEDMVEALCLVVHHGSIGESYCISSNNTSTNKHLVQKLATLIRRFDGSVKLADNLIEHVEDRLGHDRRYAVNADKFKGLCPQWRPLDLDRALENTVKFYIQQ